MKPLILISAVSTLAVLTSCKKEPANGGPPDKKTGHSATQPDTANKPPLPVAPPAVPAPPERSKELASALALSDSAEREAAIHLFLRDLPPAKAADLLLADLPTDPAIEKILGEVLVNFAIEQPEGSAAWLSAAPEFPGKTTAVRATADLWQRIDYAATLKWIDSLPAGPNRQSALKPIAAHISANSEHRADELNAISSPRLRSEVEALIEKHGE